MSWRDLIPGCFGAMDRFFAGHPNDAERAKAMLIRAFAEAASWSDIEGEARQYLSQQGCSTQHIDAEIRKMRDVSNYADGGQPNYFSFSAEQKP